MSDRTLYLGPLTDSRRWDHVPLRADDVIVVTPPKSGTTWMQTILALLFSGDPDVHPDLKTAMPWLDFRHREIGEVAGRLAAQTRRRSLKSHTPLDGLPIHPEAHYICVFRHPLDAHFSFRNHARLVPFDWFDPWYPQDDPDRRTFRRFLDGGAEGFDTDVMPLAHILRHYDSALALAHRPNVTLFHYADMTRDLPGTVRQLADLLGLSHPPALMEALTAAATFAHMKSDPARYAPLPDNAGTGASFFHSGSSGKWHGQLTTEELAAYEAVLTARLSPADRAWLEDGSGLSQPDPPV